jgi:hypothetical protein
MLQVKTKFIPKHSVTHKERVKEVRFDHELMVTTVFSKVDYCDCFEIKLNEETHLVENIDALVRRYFLAQPFWLRAVSFQLFSKKKLCIELKNNHFQKGDFVGVWKVYGRDEQEIAFGQDMGVMEYVFTFHLSSPNLLKVATVVHYKWLLGEYYFKAVKLFHKPFVVLSLNNLLEN